MKTRPKMYKKDILDIDYDLLKKNDIKALLFDFDNTLTIHGSFDIDKRYIELFKKLKKDFKIIVVSNSIHHKKLDTICNLLDVSYIGNSKKPFKYGYKKLNLKLRPNQIAMIGDQVITDVWGANRMGYFSILIDPITKNEMIFTKINRLFESISLKKNKIKRGEYYG